MLLRFTVENFRSIRDKAVLDLEAVGLSDRKNELLSFKGSNYLPVISIHGKNGGGKSNIIRAMWLAVQFIRNAQKRQNESSNVPVTPFLLNDYSKNKPTFFEFEYVYQNIKYKYGFSATVNEIVTEYLFWWPKGQQATIFERNYQNFKFPTNNDKKIKTIISKMVPRNQLYFAMACMMNYKPCLIAMRWFRNEVYFSRDYIDIDKSIIEYSNDQEMLNSIVKIAKLADVGITDMKFKIDNHDIKTKEDLERIMDALQSPEQRKALEVLYDSLRSDISENGGVLHLNKIEVSSMHKGIDSNNKEQNYMLPLTEESDGTIKIMAKAAALEAAIRTSGVFIIDEIENRLHPLLVEYIINRFQKSEPNNKAQLIFTTHSNDIINRELLRRDQYYFVDKSSASGATELYSLTDFSPRIDDKIGRAYLRGKYGAIPFIEEQ